MASAETPILAPPARARRRSALPTRTISLVISGVFHVILVLAAAAVVWRTAVGPGPLGPSARITFENPGEDEASDGSSSPRVSDAVGSPGTELEFAL